MSGAALFIGAAFVHAVDRYVLDLPAFVMAGDPDISFSVTPLTQGEEDTVSHTVRFVDLPPGVSVVAGVGPSSSIGSTARFNMAGRQTFQLRISPSVVERRVWVKVQNNATGRIQGMGAVNVERPVYRFGLTPLGTIAPRAGTPFLFQVMAFDEVGAVVRSFRGPVTLGVSRGQVRPTQLAGDVFDKGTATVNVEFSEGDLFEPLQLSVIAAESYGIPTSAQGSVDVLVLPGAGQ